MCVCACVRACACVCVRASKWNGKNKTDIRFQLSRLIRTGTDIKLQPSGLVIMRTKTAHAVII